MANGPIWPQVAPKVNLMCMMLLEDSGASGPSKFNSVENVRHIKFRLWTGLGFGWCTSAVQQMNSFPSESRQIICNFVPQLNVDLNDKTLYEEPILFLKSHSLLLSLHIKEVVRGSFLLLLASLGLFGLNKIVPLYAGLGNLVRLLALR